MSRIGKHPVTIPSGVEVKEMQPGESWQVG